MGSPRENAGADGAAALSSGAAPYAETMARESAAGSALPPIEVDPMVLKHQRGSLLAKMFGTKRAPDKLGRYELHEELGRGGMGVVYKAHDPKLNRHVALKLITKDDPRMRDRFRREAQAIAKVKHPNIIDIYDTDSDENDRPYITMEYVDGQTLQNWLLESPRDIYDIFKVFAAAGRGLEVIHEHGIVHHDFKPENVMIGRDGRVLVADFGLARATLTSDNEDITTDHDAKDAFKVNITQTGALLGTLHYMAPELLEKTRGDIRTDQFAFCVSLYEALTGERFFQLRGKTKREVYDEILRCQVKALPRVKKVPRRVEAAIRKGLSVRPADRHPSMKELTDLLGRVSKRPERRRWFTWMALALVVVLALVGALVVTRAIIDQSSSMVDFDSEAGDAPRAESVVAEAPAQVASLPGPVIPEQEQPPPPPPAVPAPSESATVEAPAPMSIKAKKRKIETAEFKLHAGDFDAAAFDFGRMGERTVSTLETIELPATKTRVKCREYDANKPRAWVERTLDLRGDKRTIICRKGIGPSLK